MQTDTKKSYEVEFLLPKKISTNAIYSGVHWTTRAKHKDMFVWAFIEVASKIPQMNTCDIEFNYEFKSRLLDVDNCVYMSKLITDCLRHYRKIKDDTPDIVKSIKITSCKGKEDKVLIKITTP